MRYADVQEMIAAGKAKEAIGQLLDFLKNREDQAPVNELILLSSRLVNHARSQRLGLIEQEEASRVQAQIDLATLEIAGEIREALDDAPAAGTNKTLPTGLDVLRLLFAESNPFPDKQLSSAEESRELGLILRDHPNRDLVRFQKEFAITLKLLLRILNEDHPDLLHLSVFANEEGCYLHSAEDDPQFVSNASLLTVFDLIQPRLRCVFFNTWISADLAIALSRRISWVMGSSQLISNQAAIAFATGFYQALAYGKDIPEAFEMGKQVLSLENLQSEQKKLFLVSHGKIVSPL